MLLSTLHMVADAAERLFVWFLVEPSLHGDAVRMWSLYILSACLSLSRSAYAASHAVSPISVSDGSEAILTKNGLPVFLYLWLHCPCFQTFLHAC